MSTIEATLATSRPSAVVARKSGRDEEDEEEELKTIIDRHSTSLCNTISPHDSDSGHGLTSSSSTASTSSDNDDGQVDCFVEASDELVGVTADDAATAPAANGTNQQKQTDSRRSLIIDNQNDPVPELKVRLGETTQILRMALSNEFVKALELCSKTADRELYASLANATLCFIRTALTMEVADLQAALAAINQSSEVSSKRRRKTSTASMVMRFLYRPNYNLYSDDEIHAELVHAESLLMLALVSFLADQSIICLVRGAFRIRTCYQRYKECLYIMENRSKWSSDEARRHFESGVRMGHGIFNLLMSYLPSRVLRFLEYVGFSGNRSIGIDELEHSVQLNDGLRSVFSALVILTYHSYVENLFGLGYYDANKVEQLNETFLAQYPNSAFFLLFLGRYHQMQGQLDKAIESFHRCIRAQDDWKQFHSICHWEIMWSYAVQMDWRQAAHYSDLLRKHSKWSQASYTYQYGTFLYAQLVEDERGALCPADCQEYKLRMEEICAIMRTVPELRVRYAGKTIPAEKFAITRSIRFLEQSNRLTLPALEFLYIWNVFPTLTKSPEQLEGLLGRINGEINHLETSRIQSRNSRSTNDADDEEQEEEDKDKANTDQNHDDKSPTDEDQDATTSCRPLDDTYYDDLNLLSLLKGVCLKYLDRFSEAEASFMDVISSEAQIKLDTFLVPHTAMELAILNLSLKQYEASRDWIKLARQNYTGYLLETIVHFRLHATSRLIRLEKHDLELSGSSESGQSGN